MLCFRKLFPAFTQAAAAILIFLLALYLAAIALNGLKFRSQVRRAAEIVIGDSAANVENVLGQPGFHIAAGQQIIFRYERETWVYYWWMKPEFYTEPPFFFPFQFRLGPQRAVDLVIEFDDAGRVVSVSIPK